MARARAILCLVLVALATLPFIPLQWACNRLHWRIGHFIPVWWHRALLWALDVRVRQIGPPMDGRPLLIAANHVSWLDIPVIGSLQPLSFIAKAEVGTWPGVSTLANLARTLYVDRARRSDTGKVNAEIAERLADGDAIVLFPEGTTGYGTRLLPLRSALLGAVREAILKSGADHVFVQPLAIVYSRVGGLPMGWAGRALVAWPGDVELGPSVWGVMGAGGIDVEVYWGAPIASTAASDRKLLARRLEQDLARLLAAGCSGRPVKLAAPMGPVEDPVID